MYGNLKRNKHLCVPSGNATPALEMEKSLLSQVPYAVKPPAISRDGEVLGVKALESDSERIVGGFVRIYVLSIEEA